MVKDGEFGFVFTSCGSWIYEPCMDEHERVFVMGIWVYRSISWIYGFDLLEVSMLNVLEFSVLRLIMNVG